MLRGLPNLRDLGGVPCDSGRVRPGLVYRSPSLGGLLPEDARALASLDPEAIIDMRGDEETRSAPAPALPDRRLSLPLPPKVERHMREAMLAGRVTAELTHSLMVETYVDFIMHHSHVFAALLRRVAEARRPVIFHCTAGKDRTGVAAALFLTACGAGRSAIEADYLRSAGLWSPKPEVVALVPEAAREALFGVQRDYLDAAFAALDEKHGSAMAFVVEALGGEDALSAFRARYVDPSGIGTEC